MMQLRSVAITGADGFFGWHLRCRLRALHPGVEVHAITRETYDDEAFLASSVDGVDAVFHLAGATRGATSVVHETNLWLADRLICALEKAGGTPYLAYANTTQTGSGTAYGISKREAGLALASWGQRTGTQVADLHFPNLFGEGGRPNHNSAVATFCDDLAHGRDSMVNPDGRVELLHVQDACAAFLDRAAAGFDGADRIDGRDISIGKVYERLARLHAQYRGAGLPALTGRLDLNLFNALRFAMFPASYPIPLDAHRDPRGLFAELARGHRASQTSYIATAPGQTRGDHYHFSKVERFVVVGGTGVVRLRRLLDNDVVSFWVSGDRPVAIDMPPLYVHNITNTGDGDLVTVLWAIDHFDPASPDTYPEQVTPVGSAAST